MVNTCKAKKNEFEFIFILISALDDYSKINYSENSSQDTISVENKIREKYCWFFHKTERVQQFIERKPHFDVVLIETLFCEEFIMYGQYFNAPVISISAVLESIEMRGFSAMPALKSFSPEEFNGYSDDMNFWQRMNNMLSYFVITREYSKAWEQAERRSQLLFPTIENQPSLDQLKRNISLIILNSHSSLGFSRPLMPNMIEVGGLAINPNEVQALSSDMQAFLDEAQFGAVYFSLGSFVNMSNLPIDIRTVTFKVFRELSQVRFLVKGDDEMIKSFHNVPNVLVRTWLPQKAILKHPNLMCFITHGGINSIQESIFYSKPIIVIPFFFDQFMNAKWANERGYGIEIPFNEITPIRLKSTIQDVLHSSRYLNFANK